MLLLKIFLFLVYLDNKVDKCTSIDKVNSYIKCIKIYFAISRNSDSKIFLTLKAEVLNPKTWLNFFVYFKCIFCSGRRQQILTLWQWFTSVGTRSVLSLFSLHSLFASISSKSSLHSNKASLWIYVYLLRLTLPRKDEIPFDFKVTKGVP